MAHPIDVHVGKRLRMRRTILGMSQETIGKSIGVSFQQIQKYERGINRMGASRLFEFSKILSVPVSYFFDEYEGKSMSKPISGFAEEAAASFDHEDKMASRETMEMMRAYYQIRSKAVRKRVFELVKSLASEQNG